MNTQFTYTSEFHSEFRSETTRLLARRLLWFLALSLLFALLYWLWVHGTNWRDVQSGERVGPGGTISLVLIDLAVCIVLLVTVARKRLDEASMLRIAFWFLLYRGAVSVIDFATFGVGSPFPWSMMVFHVLAAILLPWSLIESLKPMAVLLAANAAAALWISRADLSNVLLPVLLSPLAVLPGALISWLKHSRRLASFKLRFLQSRYGEMRQDLVDARRIHEAMFPQPGSHGPIRFDYRYEPLRQIGGDYLFAKHASIDEEHVAFNMLLIDVTGHGIAAALAVNRLSGEVERLYAEDPHAKPGNVLRALNRYVHLTIANHSVYATALCARFDPREGVVEYANGGHPPAFIRAVDGRLETLDATSFVLGACPDEVFDPSPITMSFRAGDSFVAYTDGATEARNDDGKMLRVVGIQRVLADRSRGGASDWHGWAEAILREVEAHRSGPPSDDTLVVEVHHALAGPGSGERAGARAGRRHGAHAQQELTGHG